MRRILILDDKKNFGATLARQIRRCDEKKRFLLEDVCSIDEVIVEVQKPEAPDLLLIDHHLGPGPDGIEVMQQIKKINPFVDVILFTGDDDPRVGITAYEAGAHRYIPKPFEIEKLINVLYDWSHSRSVRLEKENIYVLTDIIEKIQDVLPLCDIANLIVEGGIQLGFERARLFLVDQEKQQLRGLAQKGLDALGNFTDVVFDIQDSPYANATSSTARTTKFNGLELGASVLAQRYNEAAFPRPVGEWVDIALHDDEECIGILALDNYQVPRTYHQAHDRVFDLLSHQAAAALRRALRYEEEISRTYTNQIAERVVERAKATGGSLHALLLAIYHELNVDVSVHDYVALFRRHRTQNDTDKIETWLHIENDVPKIFSTRSVSRGGLTEHLFAQGEAAFCPQGTLAYRKEHDLAPPQTVARAWMGIPIKHANEVVGVFLLEDYKNAEPWDDGDFNFCCAVIERLSSTIYAAWVHQQLTDFVNPLMVLQRASETIIQLAQEQEEWLWHATLTLITAGYGFRFDRAMLFLRTTDPEKYVGKIGIGHLEWTSAEAAWRQDEEEGLTTFEEYIRRLRAGTLTTSTPVDCATRAVTISLSEAPAFRRLVESHDIVEISAKEVSRELPQSFINVFGTTDYALIPLKGGDGVIGVVVLDTIWGQEPQNRVALDYIDALTNEAALVFEILQASKAQKLLVDLPNEVLTEANIHPLDRGLYKVGEAARFILQADSVSIYPFVADEEPHQIDMTHAVWAEGDNGRAPESRADLTDFMAFLAQSREPVWIDDIRNVHSSGISFAEDPVVREKGIRSFVGLPIIGLNSGRLRGLMYINFNFKRMRSENTLFQARAFANLVAVVLRNWREAQGLRDIRRLREQELALTHEVVEQALSPTVEESTLIRSLLQKTRNLLLLPDVSLAMIIRDWEPSTGEEGEPQRIHRQYFLQGNNSVQEGIDSIHQGLSALAMREQKEIHVPDVSIEKYRDIYIDRQINTKSEIDIPIISEDRGVIGVINVESPYLDAFTQTHIEMVKRMAATARLILDSCDRNRKQEAVVNAAKLITEPTELQPTLAAFVNEIHTIAPDLSALTLWHQDVSGTKLVLGKHVGIENVNALEADQLERNRFINHIMNRKTPLWAENLKQRPILRDAKVIRREGLESSVAFPLRAQGKAVGVLFLNYRHHHHFTEAERTFMPILAHFVAMGINDALMLARAKKERTRHKAAVDISDAIGGTLDRKETLDKIQDHLDGLYKDCHSCIVVIDEDGKNLKFASSLTHYPITHSRYKERDRIPLNRTSYTGTLSLLSSERKTKLLSNARHVRVRPATFKSNPEEPEQNFPEGYAPSYLDLVEETRSQLTITLYSQRMQKLLGALVIESNRPDRFTSEDEFTIWGIAKQIRFALERHLLVAENRFADTVASTTAWAAGIAHDLHREIGRIRRRASWIRNESDHNPAIYQYTEEIEASVIELLDVVQYSRQEMESSKSTFDVVHFATRVIGDFLKGRGGATEMHTDVRASSLLVSANTNTLRRVLHDLARNAIEAMKDLPVQKLILRISYADDGFINLEIEDSGSGITDFNIREKIFIEPTSQKKGHNRGRGLILARFALTQMGGSIRLLPHEPGRGAIFQIRLPGVK